MRIGDVLRRLDAYPRTLEDFSVRTVSGAAVTVISTSIIVMLIFLECLDYIRPKIHEDLFVDTTRNHKLRINLDLTVHSLACSYVSLDAMDSSGDQHLRVDHDIFKHRLDLQGNPLKETEPIKEIVAVSPSNKNSTCGSCYGAELNSTQCCNTCEEVLDSYRQRKWNVQLEKIEQCKDKHKRNDIEAFKEGCRVQGHLEVNRMAGSFHIAPGNSFSIRQFHIHDFQFSEVKLDHTINHLSFGDKIDFAKTHPLDGLHTESDKDIKSEMYNYYLKIVPTLYARINHPPIHTNQFSVTRYKKDLSNSERGMPGIFFSYELSPLMVKYEEKKRSFGHFATNCCSIIGGVFTVAGIIAVFLNTSLEALQRKLEIGKMS
ncbi:endoplasmic reticulum-Golgi intermediate compartment protein 3 [Ceratitis capitata]|uniref:endoplasmic reticulum-Golgi intermediate compartment protein 3 n=1 Tax=Ceratitis capitata TaxID=7213 RepID=UPI000329B4B3|nr:endoplasmic reticulum-Golgi intermediate compartment protein 3 [Ceratitis capitata]XP_012155683.1 endoplasmic reticulum-Golgi intermediate compartment protein 3 [Ceratitis capitata]